MAVSLGTVMVAASEYLGRDLTEDETALITRLYKVGVGLDDVIKMLDQETPMPDVEPGTHLYEATGSTVREIRS